MPRLLFVNWKDPNHPPSQFSYPGLLGLHGILDGDPVTLADGSELYLDPDEVRSAYLVNLDPATSVISSLEPLN